LSGSSPSTCLAWETLPVAHATASIALGILWPHKPRHYAKLGIPSGGILSYYEEENKRGKIHSSRGFQILPDHLPVKNSLETRWRVVQWRNYRDVQWTAWVCGRGMKLNILVEFYCLLYLKVCIMNGIWYQFWEGCREACNATWMCSTNTEFFWGKHRKTLLKLTGRRTLFLRSTDFYPAVRHSSTPALAS
jgi:hypothetical protein